MSARQLAPWRYKGTRGLVRVSIFHTGTVTHTVSSLKGRNSVSQTKLLFSYPATYVGVGACAAARKPAVPTRSDLCYEVFDREIVAKRC